MEQNLCLLYTSFLSLFILFFFFFSSFTFSSLPLLSDHIFTLIFPFKILSKTLTKHNSTITQIEQNNTLNRILSDPIIRALTSLTSLMIRSFCNWEMIFSIWGVGIVWPNKTLWFFWIKKIATAAISPIHFLLFFPLLPLPSFVCICVCVKVSVMCFWSEWMWCEVVSDINICVWERCVGCK